MSSGHQLLVLGTPSLVTSDGRDVELPLGKPLAALCFIALEASRVTRDDLATVLWPDVPRERGRASVRQALWLIRKAASAEVIEERDGALELADSVETDLDQLEQAVISGRLVDAWHAWRSGPLADFRVPDAPRWNAWADRLRGEWERRFGEALEVQATAEDGQARLVWLERALEVRPYRESVHALLVEAYLHLHRLEEAEAALHEARRVVDGATPGLFDELADRVRTLRREAFQESDDGLRCEFVGRATEFSTLTTLWRSVLSGRPRAAAVVGPAGIGKTRLAEQFLELAEQEGARVVDAKGVATETALELGTLGLLAKQLLGLPGAAGISSGSARALGALVPSEDRNGDPPPPLPRTAGLADAIADLVAAVAHESPLVLHIDDVHWIDSASLTLLLRLVRSLGRAPVLLLMTCRTQERATTALRALRRFEACGGLRRLLLGPLSRAEVAEMLGLMFTFTNSREADECAERLYDASDGNPLFLLELLHHLADQGLIQVDGPDLATEGSAEGLDGGWSVRTLRLPETLELPSTVREALHRRVDGLGADARRVAWELAHASTPLGTQALAERAGLADRRFSAALSELLEREVVRWTRHDRLEVAHDCLREALRAGSVLEAESGARPRWTPVRWVVGIAAALGLVALTLDHSGAASAEAPFGGGVLFALRGDVELVYRIRGGPDGEPQPAVIDSLPVPQGLRRSGAPVRAPGGGWILGAAAQSDVNGSADAWLIEDGDAHEVLALPGDDGTQAIGPGNGQLLVNTEDRTAPLYTRDLLRMNRDSGERTLLVPGASSSIWARDGSIIIVAITRTRWDSVAVVRPDGTRLHTLAVPGGRLGQWSWCDARRTVFAVSLPEGGSHRVWAWRPGVAGEVERVTLAHPPTGGILCSPDGRFLAYPGWIDGQETLVLEAFDGDGVWTLPQVPSLRGLYWVPTGLPQAPRSVRIEPDSVVMVRGEHRLLEAVVEGGAELDDGRAEWSSSDPLTVSVSRAGELVGNGPGTATLRYVVDGWLADSVRVRVEEGDTGPGVLFADPLTRLDRQRFRVEGDPPPEQVLDDEGRPVLDLGGDGRFVDGIVTRQGFDLTHGATAQVDFRLPLTRVDRQSLNLELITGEPLPEGSTPSRNWRVDEQIAVRWPAYELQDFDPALALFYMTGPPMGPVSVAGALRDGQWNRISLQVQPDGRAMLYMNGQLIARTPHRLNLAGKRWHVALLGRGVDTDLWVRNLTLDGEPIEIAAPIGVTEGGT